MRKKKPVYPAYVSETPNPLQSMSQGYIANHLSGQYLSIVRDTPALGGTWIAEKVERMAAELWPELSSHGNGLRARKVQQNHNLIRTTFAEILEELDRLPEEAEQKLRAEPISGEEFEQRRDAALDAQRVQFMATYAKIAHLYELAGLAARDNFFKAERENPTGPGYAQGSSTDFIRTAFEKTQDLNAVIDTLSLPTLEFTMTSHPTEVTSVAMSQALYQISLAVNRERGYLKDDDELVLKHRVQPLKDALTLFAHTDLITKKDGKPANLSVRDEMQKSLYFMNNIYDAMPRIYRKFDKPLRDISEKKKTEYDRTRLNLHMPFSDWTVGDKDGNAKVNAQTTLEGFILRRRAIVNLYLNDLQEAHLLPEWQEILKIAKTELDQLWEEIEPIGELQMTEAQFNRFSERLAGISAPLNHEKLEADAKESYQLLERNGKAEEADHALEFLRRVRNFKFHYSKPEYRETADEYTRIVQAILNEAGIAYDDSMSEEQHCEILTKAMDPSRPGNQAAELWHAFREKHGEALTKAANNPYQKQSDNMPFSIDAALPIAYHTMKRMELARDHPDMITHNVLAECTNASKTLEAVFLQKAAASYENRVEKRPVLSVVPLFEEPEVMKRVKSIARSMYENPAYQAQLDYLKNTRGTKTATQRFQIAHSDNMRRSSLTAARPLIHDAHHDLREVGDAFGITSEFYEGGSLSDANRNGIRSPTALASEYGNKIFLQITAQGGDKKNLYNDPAGITRLYSNNFSHMARLNMPEHFPEMNERVEHKRRAQEMFADLMPTETRDGVHVLSSHALNREISRVLTDTALPYYEEKFFTPESLGIIIAQAGRGYNEEKEYITAGSRAAARSDNAGPVKKVATIDPRKDIRTITFSVLTQKAGLGVAWLAHSPTLEGLSNMIEEAYSENSALDPSIRDFLSKKMILPFKPLDGKKLAVQPRALREFYDAAPVYRDVIDFVAYSLAHTDLEGLEKYNPELQKHPALLETYRDEYRKTSRIAYAALTGHELKEPKDKGDMRAYRDAMRVALPHLAQSIEEKSIYLETLQMAGLHWRDQGISLELGRDGYDACTTVIHGRSIASDPAYCKGLSAAKGILFAPNQQIALRS